MPTFSGMGYECNKDTGDASPAFYGNVNYEPHDSRTTETHIAALFQTKHMCEIDHSSWMSKALLAHKPPKKPFTTSCILVEIVCQLHHIELSYFSLVFFISLNVTIYAYMSWEMDTSTNYLINQWATIKF
jgi:hypothetical protein